MRKGKWLFFIAIPMFCFFLSCNRVLGERRIVSVRNDTGGYTIIYLKTNYDIAVISESPSMKVEALYNEKETAHSDQPYFLYKDIQDTLFIVWFSTNPTALAPLKTDACIYYIWGGDFRYETEDKYKNDGFEKFPD